MAEKIDIQRPSQTAKVTMATTTYTREWLKGLPEREKQSYVDGILRNYVGGIHRAAGNGKTSHLVAINMQEILNPLGRPSNMPTLTMDDLVKGFQRIFPDSSVSIKEEWVETKPNTREFKKGILIDWS